MIPNDHRMGEKNTDMLVLRNLVYRVNSLALPKCHVPEIPPLRGNGDHPGWGGGLKPMVLLTVGPGRHDYFQ